MRSSRPDAPWPRCRASPVTSSSPCGTRWPASTPSRSSTGCRKRCPICCGSLAWRRDVTTDRNAVAVDDAAPAETCLVDAAEIRHAMEYYARQDWTDGLPVVPVTESYLSEFLARTSRDPHEVL